MVVITTGGGEWFSNILVIQHDPVLHANVLSSNHTCQLTVLAKFLLNPLLVTENPNFTSLFSFLGHKLCCVVAVVLNIHSVQLQQHNTICGLNKTEM